MLAVILVILSTILGCGVVNGNHLWTFDKPGDIILHGIFPLRLSQGSNSRQRSDLNFEAIIWMTAMIERITEINRAKILPGNLTIGYSIRDSSCDPDIGIKQALSMVDQIINDDDGTTKYFHFPAVIGPACDNAESNSYKLLEMFNIPRILYTTTSSRFHNPLGDVLQTVPSDLVHVESLLRVLNDMGRPTVCVIASSESVWRKRAHIFQINMKRRKLPLRNVVYMKTVNNISQIGNNCQVAVVFANEARLIIKRQRRQGLSWIAVSKFDDPLLKVFDDTGNMSNKTVIHHLRRNDFQKYKEYLVKKLEQKSAGQMKNNWLNVVLEKFISVCGNGTGRGKECRKSFQQNIESVFKGIKTNVRSSLTIQGVIDAVDIVVNSMKDVLQNCDRNPLSCLSSHGGWLNTLRETKLNRHGKVSTMNKHGVLTGQFSIQVLRRTKSIFGRRMMVHKGWVFTKVREWNITEDLSSLTISSNVTTLTEVTDKELPYAAPKGRKNETCLDCNDSVDSGKKSNCKLTAAIVDWGNKWAIPLYIVQLLVLSTVLASLVYFVKHKSSPIMILCCSWPDNVILIVLCLLTSLPIMHIGQQTFERCLILWPAVNVIFGLYTALLLTKTLFVQNVFKCEVATDRPGRRMLFGIFIAALQLVILITSSALGFASSTRAKCSTRGLVVVCDIKNSSGIFFSMALNCLLLILLVILAVRETTKQQKNFCRTENLIGVAVVAFVSYLCLIITAYFNLVLKHHLVITLVTCLLYLANPIICLVLIYIPTLRLVSTWLRQHTRQQRNLTSIKRAQVVSAKRQSAGPLADSIFNIHFSPELSLIPSRHSGYYFDMRPESFNPAVSGMSSLVRSVHEPTHVVFGYGRCGNISAGESVGFQTSLDDLDTISHDSFYDNVPRPQKSPRGPPPRDCQELLREIASYCEEGEHDVFVNKQCEESIEVKETKKWPSLDNLRASDI